MRLDRSPQSTKPAPTTFVGIDCATDPRKIGLALAHDDGSSRWLAEAQIGGSEARVRRTVLDWLALSDRVVIAIDAPLGWPSDLGDALAIHKAGEPIDRAAHAMFRRETDRFVRRRLKKQSLDVGADRIARTAFSALVLLKECREASRRGIPLAWHPSFNEAIAIEVYPAATLRAHKISDRGYKKPAFREARDAILDRLSRHFEIRVDRSAIQASVDALDACICVLAGMDFDSGAALPPEKEELAYREGWIWVRDPETPCECYAAS